jgi:hypothetical protein
MKNIDKINKSFPFVCCLFCTGGLIYECTYLNGGALYVIMICAILCGVLTVGAGLKYYKEIKKEKVCLTK